MENINIDFYRDPNLVVTDAYDRFISKLTVLNKAEGAKLFAFSGCAPNVGATTVTIGTAISLAGSHWRTLMIDADFRKDTQVKRLNENATIGFSNYLNGDVPLDDIICGTSIPNLNYITCGNSSENPIALLNSLRFEEGIRELSTRYDYILLDSPSLNTTIDANIIALKTSGIILVAGYMSTRTTDIQAAKRELEQSGVNIIGIVLNNVGGKDYRRYIGNYDYFMGKNLRRLNKKLKKKMLKNRKQ